jgi:hypothetical protein
MSSRVFFDVDPAMLRLPLERIDGADPAKLMRSCSAPSAGSFSSFPPAPGR